MGGRNKGSTIGSNPLDQVIPQRPATPPPVNDPEPVRAARERVTIALPAELMERARNYVYWTPGKTLAGLVEASMAHELKGLEAENKGAFKPRNSKLTPGRRMKD